MAVEGDICASRPTFFLYHKFHSRTDNHQNMAWLYGYFRGLGYPDPMPLRVGATVALIQKRCGKLPSEMSFVARRPEPLSPENQRRLDTGKLKKVPWQFKEYYSARVFLKDGMRLESDNPEQEAAYWREVNARLAAADRAERDHAVRFAVGAAIVGLMGTAAYMPILRDLQEQK